SPKPRGPGAATPADPPAHTRPMPDPAASTARRPGAVARCGGHADALPISRWTGAGVCPPGRAGPAHDRRERCTRSVGRTGPPGLVLNAGTTATPAPPNRRRTPRCPEPPIRRRPGERPFRRDRADPARTPAPAPPATRGFRSGSRIVDGKARPGVRASGGSSPPPATAPRQRSRAQATGRFHGKRIHGHARSCDHGGVPTPPPAPVLLVASSGGHLAQLWSLRPWWSGRARAWVTFDTPDAAALLGGEEEVHWAHHPTTRSIANLLRNTGLAARVLTARRPA